MRVCGLDIGLKGGLVVVESTESFNKTVGNGYMLPHIVHSLPLNEFIFNVNPNAKTKPINILDINALVPYLEGVDHIYIEQVASSTGQGVASMFSFGIGFGQLLTLCQISNVPYTLVRPAVWQKVIFNQGLIKDYCKDAKERAYRAYGELLGTYSHALPSSRYRKPHDGIIDATLIAYHGLTSLLDSTDII